MDKEEIDLEWLDKFAEEERNYYWGKQIKMLKDLLQQAQQDVKIWQELYYQETEKTKQLEKQLNAVALIKEHFVEIYNDEDEDEDDEGEI